MRAAPSLDARLDWAMMNVATAVEAEHQRNRQLDRRLHALGVAPLQPRRRRENELLRKRQREWSKHLWGNPQP